MKPIPTITEQCGTEAGYQRHTRIRREQTCPPCRAAHAEKMRAYLGTTGGRAAARRYRTSAKGRAVARRANARWLAKTTAES